MEGTIVNRLTTLLALLLLAPTAAFSQAFDAFPRADAIIETDIMLSQTNSAGAAGQKFTRGITWSNVLESLITFPNWPASSGGGTGEVSTAQLLSVSNITITASNALETLVRTKQHGSTLLTNLTLSGIQYLSTNDSFTLSVSNAPNNSTLVFGRGTYPVAVSMVDSNLIAGSMIQGAKLLLKTNVVLEGNNSAILDGSAALGEILWLSNCSHVTIRGFIFRGMTNHNPFQLPPFGGGANSYLWAGVALYDCDNVTIEHNRFEGFADHGILDHGANSGSYPASSILSTNNIIVRHNYLSDVGSVRTNPPGGNFKADGTAIVPTGWEVSHNKIVKSFRGIEPYNESGSGARQFFNCWIHNNEIIDSGEAAITMAGSTNGSRVVIENNNIWWSDNPTFHGIEVRNAPVGSALATGIEINGGHYHIIKNNRIIGAPWNAIGIYGGAVTLNDIVVEGNYIDLTSNTVQSASGIFAGDAGFTHPWPVRRIRIINNVVKRVKTYGLYGLGISDSLVEGNSFIDPVWPGVPGPAILLQTFNSISSNNIVRNNFIHDSVGLMTYGITVSSGALETILDGNKIQGFVTAPILDSATSGQTMFRNQLNAAGLIQNSFTNAFRMLAVFDDAYGSGWDGSTNVPTKNAVYDKIEAISGAGEVNVNGESAVTNSTRIGLVNGKSGVTNNLRSIQAGYGVALTNQGTNVMFAVDAAVIPSHTQLTTASNALHTAKQATNAVLGNLVGTVANNVTNENSTALQVNNGTLTLTPGIVSNMVASGFSTPYVSVSTNGGTANNISNFVFRSGVVVSNDATGIASFHVAASSGGSGGTNFPNINLLVGSTNLPLASGVQKAFHQATNANWTMNFALAVPESGYQVFVTTTNSGPTNITGTFNTNSVAANYYDVAEKTNNTTWTIPAGSIVRSEFTYLGSAKWIAQHHGPEMTLASAGDIRYHTNGLNLIISNIPPASVTAAGLNGNVQFNHASGLLGTNRFTWETNGSYLKIFPTVNGGPGLWITNTQTTYEGALAGNFLWSSNITLTLGAGGFAARISSTDGSILPNGGAAQSIGVDSSRWPSNYVGGINLSIGILPSADNAVDIGTAAAFTRTNYLGYIRSIFTRSGSLSVPTNAEVAQIVSTNAIQNVANTVTGTGGALTNFTFQSTIGPVAYASAATNVNIVAIMGGTAGMPIFKTIIFSNLTTTARPFSVSSVSNKWNNLSHYAGFPLPLTITNKHSLFASFMVDGSNVWSGFQIVTNGF